MSSGKFIQYEVGISEPRPALCTNRYNGDLLNRQLAGAIDSVVAPVSGIATSPAVWNLIKRKGRRSSKYVRSHRLCRDSLCKEYASHESPKDVEPGLATCQSRRYFLV
jgi:hypothetical protein